MIERRKRRKKYSLKKFYKRMFLFNSIIVLIFLVLIFRSEITGFINRQTGLNFSAPNIETRWIGRLFNRSEKNKTPNSAQFIESGNTSDTKEKTAIANDRTLFAKRFNEINGNTVIGINYSGIDNSPQSLAMASDSIYKAKIKAVNPIPSGSLVRTEITADVEKVYKGKDAKTIRLFAFGGNIEKTRLEGQMKTSAEKTDRTDDRVDVLMDFCEHIEEGKTYIIFANNSNGIISPTSGNMSFFKVNGKKVSRVGYEDDAFSMKLGEFEKQYLEK